MTNLKKEQGAETRERILNAAVQLFDEKGYDKTSLDMIAAAASVTRGAVYWHFENKQAVFAAIYERMETRFVAMMMADLKEEDKDPLRQLAELTIADLTRVGSCEQARRNYSLLTMRFSESGEMAAFVRRQNESTLMFLDLLSRYFDRARAQKLIAPDADSRLFAQMMGCFFMGTLHEYLHHPALLDLKTKARPMVEQFMRCYRVP